MATSTRDVIEVTSDEESASSVPVSRIHAPAPGTSSTGSAAVSTKNGPSRLPRSRVLAGKTLAFRGTWLTMRTEAPEELCRANGGEVSLAITSRTQYVVMGGKGTTQNMKKFTEHGSTLITEADFLGMILAQSSANKENVQAAISNSHKRSLEESGSASSRPVKVRKLDAAPEVEDMKWLHDFLRDSSSEVRLEGQTLTAFDCGGQVFKVQRGKSAIELLRKFDKFLEDCKGEYHQYHW